jgi:multidrug efflux pump subunit AcrA (membrane-fusion protein)
MKKEGAPVAAPPPAKNSLGQVIEDVRARVKAVLADRKKRPFSIAAMLLVVAFVIGLVWWLWRAPDVAVVEIQPTNVELALSVVARVRPDNLVDVRSQNGGEIVRLLHDDGDIVMLGEPLAVVRSAVEQAQTDASSARVAAAQAESRRARLAFNRTRTLADRGFSSAAAFDEARAWRPLDGMGARFAWWL